MGTTRSLSGRRRSVKTAGPAAFLGLVFLFAAQAWAGSDMTSASYKIRRSDLNSGGSDQPASSHYKMTDSAGSPGGSLLSGSTFFVFTGFSNLVSHPDSIEDLSAVTGPASSQLILSWTAPVAYGSSGTVASYVARYSSTAAIVTEVDFVNAALYNTSAWARHVPGALEVQTASGLASNTTYYFAVKGADAAGNTGYVSNPAAAATLTAPVSGIQLVQVYSSSVTITWTGLGAGNAEGYLVQGSTMPDFSVPHSSMTTDGNQTTLTVSSLRQGAFTYFRVGGINWSGAANFVVGPSTITLPGPPPANPVITAVNTSSITLAWGAVASDDGYSAEAFNNSGYSSLAASSKTVDGTASGLSIQNLSANATYYLRVGALYDAATNYAFVTPASTMTPAAIPVGGVFSMVAPSSITAAWGASNNAAGTRYQVELSSISAGGPSTGTVVTTAFSATFTGLLQDSTYWVQVKALGWAGADSPYLVFGSTITPLYPPTNVHFTSVSLSSVSASWLAITGPNVQFITELGYGGDPYLAPVTSTTAGLSSAFSGLNPNSLYFVRVHAQSLGTGRNSAYSSTISSYTLANPPVTLTTTSVTGNSISLAWDANGDPSGTVFLIERSTDGVDFSLLASANAASYADSGLLGGTFYAYRVRALNGNGIPTVYSNIVSVITLGSASVPKEPTGFWSERHQVGNQIEVTYHWHRVTQRTDGTAIGFLEGYQLYQSDSLLTPRDQWVVISTLTAETWTETLPIPTGGVGAIPISYYSWKALDNGGALSDWSVVMDDGVDLNHIYLAADTISRVIIPDTAAGPLRLEKNHYGADLRMVWQEWNSEETGRVVRSMQAKIVNVETDQEVADILFDPAILRGVIAYSVANGKITTGAPEPRTSGGSGQPFSGAQTSPTSGVPLLDASQAAAQLSLFWFNGAEWVKTSASVNTADNTVSFIGGRTGRFQIRLATHASGASLTRVYPRIITPNGDGWNDKAIFQFDNPTLLPLSGKVYDITGSMVANLKAGPNPDSSLSWDGKDSSGMVVPGGIYLYQIDLGGAAESGTLVVAR